LHAADAAGLGRSVRPCGFSHGGRDGTLDVVSQGPRKPRPPSGRVMRRPVFRGRRSATRTRGRVARPGRSSIPAALMGFIPSQCCSCPPGFEALSASRIPLAVSPASAPIIFVGGSAVPSRLDLDLVTHVWLSDSRSRDARRGFWASSCAGNPCRGRASPLCDAAVAETALGFASVRCSACPTALPGRARPRAGPSTSGDPLPVPIRSWV